MTINQTLFVSGFHRSSYCSLYLWSWLLSPTFENQEPIYGVNTVLMVCFQITTILHKNHDKILVGCQGFFILASDWLAHSYYTIKIYAVKLLSPWIHIHQYQLFVPLSLNGTGFHKLFKSNNIKNVQILVFHYLDVTWVFSNQWPIDCLFNTLFRLTTKQSSTSQAILRGVPRVTGVFLSQKAGNTENIPRLQGSWGQHGAHVGPVVPRWAPCWPHEPCYRGNFHTMILSCLPVAPPERKSDNKYARF